MREYLVYVDGACPNNGDAYKAKAKGSFAAYKLEDGEEVDDKLHDVLIAREPLHHESMFDVTPMDNGRATNNMAEAASLFVALSWCRENGLFADDVTVHICMDSELILNQVKGIYRTRDNQLRSIYKMLFAMLKKHQQDTGVDPKLHICLHHISGVTMKKSIIAH